MKNVVLLFIMAHIGLKLKGVLKILSTPSDWVVRNLLQNVEVFIGCLLRHLVVD